MEEKRLQVTAEDITAYFARLTEAIHGVPAHFVHVVDEMDHPEWIDRQEQVCHVSTTPYEAHVYVQVRRAGKPITLI
jgi:hypothetical protein